MPFLESNRLTYRQVTEGDISYLSGYFTWMNDHDVIKSLESRYFPNSITSMQVYVKANVPPNNVLLGIWTKDEYPVHIGNIRLGNIQWQSRFAEVGIVIGWQDYWNKGYATEAINTVAGYAFGTINLHKLWCGCLANNEGSIRAFQKAGFEIEGTLKQQYWQDGVYVDDVVLARFQEISK